ncbi:phosphotransferase [Hungatella hathewayi]|uniref:phosphotransferase n=1 Tax=Hungatella hathewayi TaxID=154046 RepID=UPI0035695E85
MVKDGSLCGVIDFGIMGTGDPACDYAMAWTFFDSQSRKRFCRDYGIQRRRQNGILRRRRTDFSNGWIRNLCAFLIAAEARAECVRESVKNV